MTTHPPTTGASSASPARGRVARLALIAVAVVAVGVAAAATVLSAVAVRVVEQETAEVRAAVAVERAERTATERLTGELRADVEDANAQSLSLQADADRDRAARTAAPKPAPVAAALRNHATRRDRSVQLLKNVVGKVGGIGAPRTPEGRTLLAKLVAEYESLAPGEGSYPEIASSLADFTKRNDLTDETTRLLTRVASASAASPGTSKPSSSSGESGAPDSAQAQAGGDVKEADHRKQIDAVMKLGRALVDAGKVDDAVARSDEALDLARRQPQAKRDGAVADVLLQRANWLISALRDADAVAPLREAYEIRLRDGKSPTAACTAGRTLARALLRLDRPGEAEPIIRQVAEAHAASNAELDSSEFVAARMVHATALRKLGQERAAQRIEADLSENLAFMRTVHGGCTMPEWAEHAAARGRLDAAEQTLWSEAELSIEMRQTKRVREILERIVAMRPDATGADAARIAMYRRWLARNGGGAP